MNKHVQRITKSITTKPAERMACINLPSCFLSRNNKALLAILLMLFSVTSLKAADRGINLPPTQGSTNAGAFLSGIYLFNYSNQDVYNIRNRSFTHIRVPVNVATANNPASLQKIKDYFLQTNYQGVICMFDTIRNGEGSHGDGKPNDLSETAQAWKNIHAVFRDYPNVKYEIFNEPFGYQDAQLYVDEMRYIMDVAGLPYSKSILDGMGYADDLDSIKNLWNGDLAYHIYPNWLQGSNRTQSQYSNLLQTELRDISHRVHITEFGADLRLGNVYETFTSETTDTAANINLLRGIHDALLSLAQQGKPVKATYHWHGWHNGDTYDLWDANNSYGADKIVAIQNGSNGQTTAVASSSLSSSSSSVRSSSSSVRSSSSSVASSSGSAPVLGGTGDYPSGFSKCANSGGNCSVSSGDGWVAFGRKGKWVTKRVSVPGSIACTVAAFGSEPGGNPNKCSFKR